MTEEDKYVGYPDEWDRTDGSFNLYDSCKIHYSKGQENDLYKVFVPSKFYDIYAVSAIVYSVLSLLIVIIRKDIFRRANRSVKLTVLFSIGTIMIISSFYSFDKFFYNLPCFMVPYLITFTFPVLYITCSGNIIIYLKQCYANASLYDENREENVENDENSNYKQNNRIMYNICLWFTKRRVLNFMIIYITVSMFFINFVVSSQKIYSLNPITYGFCYTKYEKVPSLIITGLFIYVFIPSVIHEIIKLRGVFTYEKDLYITLILIFVTAHLYLVLSTTPAYYCTAFNRYIPPNFFLISMFITLTYFQITIPIIDAYKLSKTVDDLEVNKKGLLQVFDNEILYKEFFEYAVSKRSVEYATFHVEYLEFKEIFNINKSFLDEFKDYPIEVPGPEPTNQKDKKLLEIFAAIYDKADEIFNKYFSEESELELNLPAKLIKKVNSELYEYNINYNRYLINGTEGHTVEYKLINCENIFDEVHEEALDSLFLNVYKGFIKETKKSFGLNSEYVPVKTNDSADQV